MTTPIDLPALPAYPDPHAFNWSKAEIMAIKAYAKAAILVDRAQMAVEVAALRALVNAVTYECDLTDVNGENWFDARDAAHAQTGGVA